MEVRIEAEEAEKEELEEAMKGCRFGDVANVSRFFGCWASTSSGETWEKMNSWQTSCMQGQVRAVIHLLGKTFECTNS